MGEQHEMQHEHIVLRDFMPFHQSHVWLYSRSVVVRLVFVETLGSRYRNPYKSYSFGFLQLKDMAYCSAMYLEPGALTEIFRSPI